MEWIGTIVDIFLHLDVYLGGIIDRFAGATHFLLFLVVFCETGLVVTPFLPGDSLIFAAGSFVPQNKLNLFYLWILLCSAAVLGDTVNYHIGKMFGNKIIEKRWIKQRHIDKTNRFFDKHGGKTIIFARFVPIIRTFAPFVAGIGSMRYRYFLGYNVIGGVAWVTLFLLLGCFFGDLPVVKDKFSLVIFAIIGISLLPPVITWLKSRLSPSR